MKKLFSYLLTFLMVFFITAATTVSLSYFGGASINIGPSGNVSGQSGFDALFSGILGAFDENKQFAITGDIEVATENGTLPLNVRVFADIADTNDIKLDGSIVYDRDGKSISIDFTYLGHTVYVKADGAVIKLTSAGIDDIKDLINSFTKDSSTQGGGEEDQAASELSSFVDELMPKLMDALSTMTEVEKENGDTEISLTIEGLASGTIITDKNDMPKGVRLTSVDLGGVKISAWFGVDFNENIIVTNPEKTHPEREYLDIRKVVSYIEDTLQLSSIGFNGNLNLDRTRVGIDLAANIKDNAYSLNLHDLSIDGLSRANIVYQNSNLYLSANNANVMLTKGLIESTGESVSGLISKYVSGNEEVGQYSDKINDFIGRFKENPLEYIKLLGILNSFTFNDEGATLALDLEPLGVNGKLSLELGFGEKYIETIAANFELNGKTYSFNGNLNINQEAAEVDESNYLNLEKVINANKDFFSTNALNVAFGVKLAGNENLELDGQARVNLKTKYLELIAAANYGANYNLDLVAFDNNAYLTLNNIKLRANFDKVKELLTKFGVDLKLENIDADKLIGGLKQDAEDIDYISLLKELSNIQIGADGLELSANLSQFGLQDVQLKISLAGGRVHEVTFAFTYEGQRVEGSLEFVSNSFSERAVNISEYLDAVSLAENVYALKDQTNFSLKAAVEGNIKGQVFSFGLDGGFEKDNFAFINAALNGFAPVDLSVSYFGDEAYLRLNNIYVKASSQLISGLIEKLGVNDIDLNELGSKLDLKGTFENIDIETIFNNISDVKIDANLIQVKIGGSLLGQSNDLLVVISIYGGQLREVEVKDLEIDGLGTISFKVMLLTNQAKKPVVNAEDYLNVEELENILNNTIESQNTLATVTAEVYKNGAPYFGANVTLQKQMRASQLFGYAKANFTMGEDALGIETYYLDGVLYAQFNGLKVKHATARLSDTYALIMELINKDPEQYSEIVYRVQKFLSTGSFADALRNVKLPEMQQPEFDADMLNGIDLAAILGGVTINAETIKLCLGAAALGLDTDINVEIVLGNNRIEKLAVSALQFGEYAIDATIELSYAEAALPELSEEERAKYIDLAELAVVGKATYNSLTHGQVSGTINVVFDYKGEPYTAKFNYGLKVENKRLLAFATGEFLGANLQVYYMNRTFYLTIMGMNIYVQFSDINDIIAFINNEFKTSINFDASKIEDMLDGLDENISKKRSFEEIFHELAGLDLDIISSVRFEAGSLEVTFNNGYQLFVNYSELIDQVILNIGGVKVELNCVDFAGFNQENFEKVISSTTFEPYTVLTNTYYAVKNTLAQTQFNVTADADVYNGDAKTDSAKVALLLDTSLPKAYGSFNINNGEQLINFGYMNDDQHLYVDYNKLEVSIHQRSLREIMSIGLELLHIDPSTISFLQDVAGDMNIKPNHLAELVPALDFGNPLNMIKLLKGLTLKDGRFEVILDGTALNLNNKNDMVIGLYTKDGSVHDISLKNIYTGKGSQKFNVTITFNPFDVDAGVPNIENREDYIDITDSPDLIRSIINTSSFNSYYIKGYVALTLGEIKAAELSVDIRVKLVKGKPEIAAVFSGLPLFGFVTDKNCDNKPGAGLTGDLRRDRTMYVYYRDGEVILRTVDEKWGAYKQFERITKVTLDVLMDNLEYYMQWLLGFADSIQSKINEAIQRSRESTDPIDISNVLLGYALSGSTHNIDVNLGEIARNPDIGSLNVGLTTQSVKIGSDENERLYLNTMTLTLHLLNDLLSLTTPDGKSLVLTNPGQDVDMSEAEAYMNSYPYYTDGEYQRKGDDKFEQSNTNFVVLSFDSDGGTSVEDMHGIVGGKLTLPVPSKVIDVYGDKFVTYKFLGWYTDAGDKFDQSGYPRSNMHLTARWQEESVKRYYKLTIKYNDGRLTSETYIVEGQELSLEIPVGNVFDNGLVRTEYLFDGFYDGEQLFEDKVMPARDVELNVRWNILTRKYYTITYHTAYGTAPEAARVLEGTQLESKPLENYRDDEGAEIVVYGFVGWFTIDGQPMDSFTVHGDMDLYAQWQQRETLTRRSFRIVEGGKVVKEYTGKDGFFAGDRLYVPAELYKSTTHGNTLAYTDPSFSTESQLDLTAADGNYTVGLMPEGSGVYTIYLRNVYTVTFNDQYGLGYSQEYYEGEVIEPRTLSKEMQDVYGDKQTTYTYNGVAGMPEGGVMPANNLELRTEWTENYKYYRTVKFNLGHNGNIGYYSHITFYHNNEQIATGAEATITVLEGTELNLAEYSATWSYKAVFNYHYNWEGISTSKDGSALATYVVTGNVTLYGLWSGLKTGK